MHSASVIEQPLIGAGKRPPRIATAGVLASLIRCGDVTATAPRTWSSPIASGGTAGDTHFGVIQGGADGAGEVVLFKEGYGVGIARHGRHAFDVLQPYYRSNDADSAQARSARPATPGPATRFKARKAKKLNVKAPARFYRR